MGRTKYRIKQEGEKFYPQYKKFLFWHNISFPITCVDDYKIKQKKNYPHFNNGLWLIDNNVYYSTSLVDAKNAIDKYIECENFNLCYKGHNIIKIYDRCKYITYIDDSVRTSSRFHAFIYPIYHENLAMVKSKIDETEANKEMSKIRNIYPYGKD